MTKTKKKNPNRNITRMEYGSTVGWNVRIYKEGNTISCFLPDRRHGGRNRALGKARNIRDVAEHNKSKSMSADSIKKRMLQLKAAKLYK